MDRFNARLHSAQTLQKLFRRTNCGQSFKVFWHNLSYSVTSIGWMSSTRKRILNEVNGYFKSGELTAVMGPSGAGKSTLLEIIAGRRINGVKGEVKFRGLDEIKIGFVPQDNCLMEFLTAKETLVFASKLLNTETNDLYHNIIANKLIVRFGLEACAHTYTNRCSGGQQKRISIALEVLSSPNILLLDEPTTGLDSHSCSHVMNILQQLVSNQTNPMAIVVTIHQPSVPIFNRFDRIYTLTRNGKCLYNGDSTKLIQTLTKVGLICDSYTSLADYMIEIASGDFGPEPITMLCNETNNAVKRKIWITMNTKILAKATKHVSHPFGEHLKILLNRSHLMLYRNPFLTFIRIFMALFMAVFISLYFGTNTGSISGCLWHPMEMFSIPVEKLFYRIQDDVELLYRNIAMLFIGLFIVFMIGIGPPLLTFPKEMQTFQKEFNNGWYSCLTYYLAKTVTDLPLQLVTLLLYSVITYICSGQPYELFRFVALILISIVLSLLAQSFGEFISAVWMNRPLAAVFIGELIPIPMMVLAGIMIKVKRMPIYIRPLSWLSFFRFGIEANIIIIYGFNRCEYTYNQFLSTVNVSAITKPAWVKALQAMEPLINPYDQDESVELTDEERDAESLRRMYTIFVSESVNGGKELNFEDSVFVNFMDINENNLYLSFAILIAYLFAFKVFTYIVLKYKLKSSK